MRAIHRTRSAPGRAFRAVGAALVLGLAVGACDTDKLIDLTDPDLITLVTAVDPENVESVRNGALFEFAQAMTGIAANNQTPGIIGIGGLLTDEYWYASTFDSMKDIDRRRVEDSNTDVTRVYQYLHRARNLAEEAEILLQDAAGDSPDRSRLMALSGYTFVLLAENWCGHVPFSRAPLGGQLEYRSAIGTEAMLDSAIVKFDRAIELGEQPGAGEFVSLARLGKARALQNKGDLDGAAAVAAQIPADFAYHVEFSSNTASQGNGVWYNVNSSRRTSASTREGVNGLPFFDRGSDMNTIDPRMPVDSTGTGIGETIPHYAQYRYDELGSDVPLATYLEAQLIIAEADLAGGTTAGSASAGNWLAILNDLRDGLELDALEDPGTAEDRVLLLYEERAYWLWMTAHRLGDLRRLLRIPAYSGMFTADELFPIGPTIFNATRGTDVAFPVPTPELNNPEYDDAGCVTTQP